MTVCIRDPLVEESPRQAHPLTISRSEAIVRELRANPEDFIEPTNQGTWSAADIGAFEDIIDTIAHNLADPDLRFFVREQGRSTTPALRAKSCDRNNTVRTGCRNLRA